MTYAFNFLLLAMIYGIWYFKKGRRLPALKRLIRTLMYIYLCMVIYVTLMPFSIPLGATNNLFMDSANFIPLQDLRLNRSGAVKEILLNILMTVPFGFLLPLLKRVKAWATVASTFVLSLGIESVQLLGVYWGNMNPRAFDVTDLITNTIGGLIGYCLYKLAGSWFPGLLERFR